MIKFAILDIVNKLYFKVAKPSIVRAIVMKMKPGG